MAGYNHGVRILEKETSIVAPIEGTAGLQVVWGTAPVNLAKDPYGAVNKPILAYSYAEAVEQLGFSYDFKSFTLCQSIDAAFRVYAVAPIILINVLDPKKHKKTNDEFEATVELMQATVEQLGILADSVEVKMAGNPDAPEVQDQQDKELVLDDDYVTSFNDEGYLVVTLIKGGAGENAKTLKVTSTSIDPLAVDKNDIIGGYNALTGEETGLELVRHVYPKFGMTPGLLLAPGWTQMPEVAAAIAAKCEEINGAFTCECILDVDTTEATKYTDVKEWKDKNGYTNKHSVVLWPMCQIGQKKYAFSAVFGALTAYTDANNDDVPYISPSNKMAPLTGLVLEDGTEITLDRTQANFLNGSGIITAINENGWKTWGNNTAAYPSTTDPKDRWFCCRRFFSWWGNSLILTYNQKVDNPLSIALIETIIDSENIRGNSYVAQGKIAAARIEFLADENPNTDILNGKMQFHVYLAPFPPAEDIVFLLEFDPDALRSSLLGGE